MSVARRSALVLSVLAAGGCSSKDSTAPVKPASVTSGATTVPTATVGTALTASPTFVVNDANGNALSNVSVTVVVASGGGSLVGAPTRSTSGATSVGTWTLGTVAGANTLTVSVNGLAPLTITANGTAGPPSKIAVVSGAGQSAAALAGLPAPVVVKVTDQYGNGVANQPVAFTVIAGGGALTGSTTATSDATGNATAPTWIMGKTNVPQTLQATSGTASTTVPASIATAYTIDVRFYGGTPDPVIVAAFQTAVARITAISTGQLSSVILAQNPFNVDSQCLTTGVGSLTETISGLVIYATVGSLGNNILGQAGPCGIRSTTRLTIVGVMKFSTTYMQTMIANGILNEVVTHEMLHVLGFGSLWDQAAINLIVNAGTDSTGFTGAKAIAACLALPGGSAAKCSPRIPLEHGRGVGSDDSHWRESLFFNELMTPVINTPPNPLSAMTIASIGDMGYTVNLNVGDSYSIPSAAIASLQQLRSAQGMGIPAGWSDEIVHPAWSIDHAGRATRIVRY